MSTSDMKTNTAIYSQMMSTPKEAQKEIKAGKLKGFTDINPMYRIQKLTEIFGPCGIGWYIGDVKWWREDLGSNESAIFCSLNLFIKQNEEWSMPISGIGGSKLAGKGVGDGINDEAAKMAYTDAISIACKALGMCHDIYYSNDRTKYDMESYPKKKEAAKEAAQEQAPLDVVASLEDAIDELKLCKSRKAVNAVNNKFKMYYGQYAEHPSERYMSTLKQMCNQYPIQQS